MLFTTQPFDIFFLNWFKNIECEPTFILLVDSVFHLKLTVFLSTVFCDLSVGLFIEKCDYLCLSLGSDNTGTGLVQGLFPSFSVFQFGLGRAKKKISSKDKKNSTPKPNLIYFYNF